MNRRSHGSRRILLIVTSAVALSVAACSDGDDTTASPTNSNSTESTQESSTTAEETTTTAPGGDLVGTWTAGAQDIVNANTANLGGVAAMECSGTLLLTFVDDSGFTNTGDISCSVGGVAAVGSVTSTGKWAVTEPGLVAISETVTTGGIEMGGVSLPAPTGVGDGVFEYSVDGDTLQLTFTDPSVGTVTQSWVRA